MTRAAIPFGLFLQKTPAAADQVHLTPDVVKRKRKRKEKTPPFLIPFGKSPGCQIHYIMSAQADTCVGAELDRVLAADGAWNVGLAAPGQRPRGRGTNFGLEGGASVWGGKWGLCPGGETSSVAPPLPRGHKNQSRGFSVPESSQGTSDVRRSSRLQWAP